MSNSVFRVLFGFGAAIFVISGLLSVAQHEWYHAMCEFLISGFSALIASDENQ